MIRNLHKARPLIGVLLMVSGMFTVPLADGIAKYLCGSYTVVFTAWARCCSGAIWILPLGLARYGKEQFDAGTWRLQLLRTFLSLAAIMLYYAAIARVPIADAAGAYFIAPIVVTLVSRLLLKEPLTPHSVLAVALGFVGVVIVIKPGVKMDVGILYAVMSGVMFAFYIVVTRVVNKNVTPLMTLAFQYSLGVILLLPWVLPAMAVPSPHMLILIALMGMLSLLSHALQISALNYAEASTLAPFIYSEIISATLVGYLFFHDFPDSATWIGIIVIVGAGLIVLADRNRSVPTAASG